MNSTSDHRQEFFAVQKGVPIVTAQNLGGRPSKLRDAMLKMEIGDSFLMPVKSPHHHVSGVWRMAKIVGIKITTRAEGKRARRIWRRQPTAKEQQEIQQQLGN